MKEGENLLRAWQRHSGISHRGGKKKKEKYREGEKSLKRKKERKMFTSLI